MVDRISIVTLQDGSEAQALRALVEEMGHDTRLMRPGDPSDVPGTLQSAGEDEVVILSAHGGPRGLWMGAFDRFAGGDLMDGPWLITAKAFAKVRYRPETVFISTACATRESGLAEAVHRTGGRLIAPNGYPEGRVILPWIGACLLSSHKGLEEAVTAANTLVGPDDQFSYG